MPSPAGHALGGLLVGMGTLPESKGFKRDLAICAVAACLPDIDFLWRRHAMETHSVGAAVIAGLVVFALSRRRSLALACTLAWCSHVLFDWLGSDDFPPLGVMALWPFSHDFYFANAFIFEAISRRYRESGFWVQNLWAVAKEVLILLPPLIVLAYWRFSRRSVQTTTVPREPSERQVR
jgi:LexA-binding, inner membrane-associated putative hydrolase